MINFVIFNLLIHELFRNIVSKSYRVCVSVCVFSLFLLGCAETAGQK